MKFLNTPCRLGQRMFENWSEALNAYFAGELNRSDIGCIANYYADIEKKWSNAEKGWSNPDIETVDPDFDELFI